MSNEVMQELRFIEVQGNKMFLDLENSLGLCTGGAHEPFETEVIKKEIKKGDVVLDIGAHIGYYTLIFANLAGKEGKVFAFEPEPDNFNLLKENVKINNYQNVVLVQKAVTNKTKEIELYLCKSNSGMHRAYKSCYCSDQSIKIGAVRLDDYFKNYYGKIDFIKIDVEGAELSVFHGMLSLLQKNNHIKILTEFAPCSIKEFGVEPKEYLVLLLECGFNLYNINEQERKIEKINLSQILTIYTAEKGNWTNLLCLKN